MAEHDLGERAAFADEITAKTAARVRSYFDSRYDWNLSRSLKNLVEQAIRDSSTGPFSNSCRTLTTRSRLVRATAGSWCASITTKGSSAP